MNRLSISKGYVNDFRTGNILGKAYFLEIRYFENEKIADINEEENSFLVNFNFILFQ